MKTSLIIFVLVQMVVGGDDEKKHVHFKIYVPEIIKHHIHTKTVFIHLHPPLKIEHSKKKLNHYEEANVEDWSSFSSYDHEGKNEEIRENGHVRQKGHEGQYSVKGNNLQNDIYNSYLPTSYGNTNPTNYYDGVTQPDYNSNYKHANSYSSYDHAQDMVGYMYPPQYAIHEDVNDIPNNDIEQYDVYKEGHKRGLEIETGHLVTKNLKDFYDDKFDEGEDIKEDGYDKEYDKRMDNGYRGNYDKEIGYTDRSGLKNAQKRVFITKITPR